MIPLVFSSLLSCVPLGAEPSSSTIVWSGTILDDPYNTAEPTALTGAQVTALETTSDQPIVGIESASTPGYYSLEVPPDADITIRVGGPDHVSTVFRGTTPAGRGIWFTGALFARQIDSLTELLVTIAPGQPAPDLDDAVQLWVEPADPEALRGSIVEIIDGDENVFAPVLLTVGATGELTEAGPDDPISLIVGLNHAPGPVTLSVSVPDGRSAETTWSAQAGDLLASPGFSLSQD